MKVIDCTGKKFGKLTVIKRSFPNSGKGKARWLCKCECGNEKIIDGYNLRKGDTRSCGCLFKFNSGLANMRLAIIYYKKNASNRGHTWELTEEQFKEITQKDCHYCGAKPSNFVNNPRCNGAYIYNGLDRINNTRGYTIDNVVSCCKSCNSAKGTKTLQEFKDWAKRLYGTMLKGEKK